MTNTLKKPPVEGDLLNFTNEASRTGFKIRDSEDGRDVYTYNGSELLRVTEVGGSGTGPRGGGSSHVRLAVVDPATGEVIIHDNDWWDYNPHRFKSVEPSSDVEVVEAKTVYAALTHATSREYAKHATSRVLTQSQNDILLAAHDGFDVDVYNFRKAATAALSLASTRAARATERREYAKEARHLIYWADAIIDNHAKGLPVYAEGERSPKLQEAKAEIQNLQATIDADRAQWQAEVETLRADLDSRQEEYDALKALSESVEATLADAKSTLDAKVAETERVYEALSKVQALAQDRYQQIKALETTVSFAQNLLRGFEKHEAAGAVEGYREALYSVGRAH